MPPKAKKTRILSPTETMISSSDDYQIEAEDGTVGFTKAQVEDMKALNNMIQDLGLKNEVPVSRVGVKELMLIKEYMEKTKRNYHPYKDVKEHTPEDEDLILAPQDQTFVDGLDEVDLVDLINAANYIEFEQLLTVLTKHVANLLVKELKESA